MKTGFILSEKKGIISDKMARPKTPKSVEESIYKRFRARGRGAAATPSDFLDLGSRPAVDKALSRLVQARKLTRVKRGVYLYPKQSKLLGQLYPSPQEVAEAVTKGGGERLLPSGALAANRLGISEQVPAKIIYLTDGTSRTVEIGNLPIELRQASTKRLATAGRVSGDVAEALRFIRKDQVTEKVIKQLRSRLSASDKKQLMKDIKLVPAWIGKVFREVADDTE